MAARRVTRAIELLTVLQSHRRVTTQFLAQTLGCSTRTIFRDLNLLREAGFSVAFDSENQTLVAAGSAPQPALSDAQWQAVLLATSLSPISNMDIYSRDLCQGMAKLAAMAPRHLRERTNNLLQTLGSAFVARDSSSQASPWLTRILEAASGRRRLQITFEDQSQAVCTTRLSTLRVFAAADGWIVRGYSTRHGSIIDIPIASIQDAVILNQTYIPPPASMRNRRAQPVLTQGSTSSLPSAAAAH